MCTEGEQMEECDDTASKIDGSPSETGDSDVDRYYSLSDDSYWDNYDSNSSSLNKVKVSALNETQNVDLTIEREDRKPNKKEEYRSIRMG